MLFSCRVMSRKNFWTIIQSWNGTTRPCIRIANAAEVESGEVKLIEAGGDETVHPIEAEYLAPEVHSLMKVSRPVIRVGEARPACFAGFKADGRVEGNLRPEIYSIRRSIPHLHLKKAKPCQSRNGQVALVVIRGMT